MKKIPVYVIGGIFLITAILLVGISWVGMSSGSEQDKGKELYDKNCEMCHGIKGDGNGPAAASFNPRPRDFTDPKFWQNNVDQEITNAIENGVGVMPASDLNGDQIKAIIDYMSSSFKPAH
jgi:mono/diheme cytochrome c family protein